MARRVLGSRALCTTFCPIVPEVLHQEGRTYHPDALVHPASRIQFSHSCIHHRVPAHTTVLTGLRRSAVSDTVLHTRWDKMVNSKEASHNVCWQSSQAKRSPDSQRKHPRSAMTHTEYSTTIATQCNTHTANQPLRSPSTANTCLPCEPFLPGLQSCCIVTPLVSFVVSSNRLGGLSNAAVTPHAASHPSLMHLMLPHCHTLL